MENKSEEQKIRKEVRAGEPNEPEKFSRKFQKTIVIERPVEEVYAFWRNFENLPRFMKNLKDVEVFDERRSHWVLESLAGQTAEWNAEITDERENELISWRSLSDGVDHAGSVQFHPLKGSTEITVTLAYNPAAGELGAAIARVFGKEPAQQVEEDLNRFKEVMETGSISHS